MTSALYAIIAIAAGGALVVLDAPSWLALACGLAIAFASDRIAPPIVKRLTTWTLQLGVIALGAGMNLAIVAHAGLTGALITATSLATAIVLGLALGKQLRVPGDTPLLVSVGTAICGGSAIAAVASVIHPKEHETSVALAVVFVLNAVGLVVFPIIGHALGLSEPVFGRWAALAIHDTSSVVGAGKEYGKIALEVATATKLARALWIVPVTIGVAILHRSGARAGIDDTGRDGDARGRLSDLRRVRWPWFILGFVAAAALVTWVPAAAAHAGPVVIVGRRLLVAALYLIGLSLSRRALAAVGARPLALGVALWIVIATISLPLAALT